MARIDVLVVVNVAKALRDGRLPGNLWMVDTNKNSMSSGEASDELVTACNVGDLIYWTVVSIDADLDLTIRSFGGRGVPTVIQPHSDGDNSWSGYVNAPTNSNYQQLGQYTMTLTVNGTDMTFDPFINASPR